MEPRVELMFAIAGDAGESVWAFFDPRNPVAVDAGEGVVTLTASGLAPYRFTKDGDTWTVEDQTTGARLVGSVIDVVQAIADGEV